MTGFMFKNNEFKKTALDFNLRICPLFEDGFNFDIGHVLENSNLTMKCPIKKVRALKIGKAKEIRLYL